MRLAAPPGGHYAGFSARQDAVLHAATAPPVIGRRAPVRRAGGCGKMLQKDRKNQYSRVSKRRDGHYAGPEGA